MVMCASCLAWWLVYRTSWGKFWRVCQWVLRRGWVWGEEAELIPPYEGGRRMSNRVSGPIWA